MSVFALKGRVIDGISDQAIEDGLVIVKGSQISYAGPCEEDRVPEGAEIIAHPEGTILPGFIDCHAHLMGKESAGEGASPDDKLLAAAYEIGILLDAGFTGIRDMSANGFALSRGVAQGFVRGPRIMPGGRVLSVTGGHCDFSGNLSKQAFNQKSRLARLCDGVEDCLLAVREQFSQGAKFIKICATGGVSSFVDQLEDVQFSFEEIQVMVEEAARHGTYVTAHCTSDRGTYQALRAGIDCVEHGVMLKQKTIDLMAEKDVSLVTTLSVSLGVAKLPDLPTAMAEKAKRCAEANIRTIEMARKAGIRIALGTDYSNSKNSPYANNGKEFEAMTRAGMTPMEAIKAGTINAAYLMKSDDVLGSLEEGKIADIVIVQGNPLEDIHCLTDQSHVRFVMKDGIIEKNLLETADNNQ